MLESVYAGCLAYELGRRNLEVSRQPTLPVVCDCVRMNMAFRPDLIIQQEVIVEGEGGHRVPSAPSGPATELHAPFRIEEGPSIQLSCIPFREGN
ncbi:MAG: GxxExxY protein [Gemmatimonadaceae bacterium]|nr:GxxExxY protein [Gemmatimonadaceae bacterium]